MHLPLIYMSLVHTILRWPMARVLILGCKFHTDDETAVCNYMQFNLGSSMLAVGAEQVSHN